ncbi:MAG: F0F1 ATP synthase subunit A, partial [Bacteroidales bacterium]|nr:F0F1 ATP synthase subunit A [Bacteroidales bacterium]
MRRIFFIIAMVMAGLCFDPVSCFALSETEEGEGVNVQHIIFEHMLDSYTWHITKVGDKDIAVYLPVILYSKTSGWHVFSSRRLHENGGSYEGFYPAPEDSAHAYKLMEKMPDGSFVRPVDLSLTKMGLAIIINSIILLLLFLPAAKWYRKHRGDTNAVP